MSLVKARAQTAALMLERLPLKNILCVLLDR
jgi:hypothetical protein